MFKFLKTRMGGLKPVVETQRQTIERALNEVNEVVALMAVKPKIMIDPETGAVALELPDQMPDEALALPAPDSDVVEKDAA
ncbi:MAG: hypothetical protein ACJAXK_002103 [Yoonia sp.]|jgi:hypothetical protein